MASATKYPEPKEDDGVLLRLREDYEQAVLDLFEANQETKAVRPSLDVVGHTSNFLDNMRLPIHRWFRYSAGFSAEWVKWLLAERDGSELRVLDPFVGSGTTCLACDEMGIPSHGIEAHPFVHRVAQAKLSYTTDPERFVVKAERAFCFAHRATAETSHYPEIIQKCYGMETLGYLDCFRQAVEDEQDGSPEAALLWMALVSSLRVVSEAGTAPWQYVLPGRRKTVPPSPEVSLHKAVQMIAADIRFMARRAKPLAKLRADDARKCATVPEGWATLVITSPPYANNYDYADATRLEMAFMGEIRGWGDLQETVRRHLVRACSQHVPPNAVNLDEILVYCVTNSFHYALLAVKWRHVTRYRHSIAGSGTRASGESQQHCPRRGAAQSDYLAGTLGEEQQSHRQGLESKSADHPAVERTLSRRWTGGADQDRRRAGSQAVLEPAEGRRRGARDPARQAQGWNPLELPRDGHGKRREL